jgi:TRAP-type C4-dicarboxylate transport system permease small subunit
MNILEFMFRGAGKSLARPGRKQATTTEDFLFSYILFIIIIGGILVLFIYIKRLTSNEIFSPSNKIHREVGRAKEFLSPPVYTGVLISP